MKYDELKKLEPLWDCWYIEECIGHGSFGDVYRIKREEFGKTYFAALKTISFPSDKAEADEILMTSGGSRVNAQKKYAEMLSGILNEIQIMEQLKGNSNIVSYEDHKIIEHNQGDQFGYDIFIRMELLEDLSGFITNHKERFNDEREIIKIGIDMCEALSLCHEQNIIHRDIKPANIFYAKNNRYKLGDFGIAKDVTDGYLTMSYKGTYNFMAPEIFNHQGYDKRADIYSLGMVLYYMLNGFVAPFMGDNATNRTIKEDALIKRMSGANKLPIPVNASEELFTVIEKACAYNPNDRFNSMKEFKDALSIVLAANKGNIIWRGESYELRDDSETVLMESSIVHNIEGAEFGAENERSTEKGKDDKRNISIMRKVMIACMFVTVLIMGGALIYQTVGDVKTNRAKMTNKISFPVTIDETVFPDGEFRKIVLAQCDIDADGILSQSEAEDVKILDINDRGIESLSGIECFPGLLKLDCSRNELNELSLIGNKSLIILGCYGCGLEKIDVSENHELVYLDCSSNRLTDLDLNNNSKLYSLYCYDNNLSSIIVSNNKFLVDLYCSDNKLELLDISQNVELDCLDCQGNQLAELNISNNKKLSSIYCSFNMLEELDLRMNGLMTEVSCYENHITKLDVSCCGGLEKKMSVCCDTGVQVTTGDVVCDMEYY